MLWFSVRGFHPPEHRSIDTRVCNPPRSSEQYGVVIGPIVVAITPGSPRFHRRATPRKPPHIDRTMRSLRELARFASKVTAAYPTAAGSLASGNSISIAPAASLLQRRVGITMSAPAAVEVDAYKVGDSTNIKWHEGSVDTATREKAMNQKGCVLWFTGLSGSGKVRLILILPPSTTFSRPIPSHRPPSALRSPTASAPIHNSPNRA